MMRRASRVALPSSYACTQVRWGSSQKQKQKTRGSSLPLYPKGIYTQATEDSIFKYIMHDDEVRNSFLSGVIGEDVTASKVLDASLNPTRSYTALRDLLNGEDVKELMDELGNKTLEVRKKQSTGGRLPAYTDFLMRLGPLYQELVQAIPTRERNTKLDLVCQTDTGLINVEVQVDPQDFWDIRILDHACGLFHRQFGKGFRWSQLAEDDDIQKKVRRVIGVSIFENPPKSPESVHALLPWYKLSPWKSDELRRNYRLLETTDHTKERAGLEFFDYNLAALDSMKIPLSGNEEGLKEWLDLLAHAHLKTEADAKQAKLPAIQKAYVLLESASLPTAVKKAYEEDIIKRENISHYVAAKKTEGKIESKIEDARGMLAESMDVKLIAKITGLSEEEIKKLRRMMKRGRSLQEIIEDTGLSEKEVKELKDND